ncbi:FAD/NAD(P)-binding protein [Curtobacterium flaccumfaciens]|uniref:FAD/NAD(P)-binding protein n=1 Tax=Curtobacterium flaccumfaciens TaxID=2035 RepID=UPI001129C925|nr:FAD/NAD(P)-binding protein [Curtobacterium flaccumfaciens]TPG05163.1 FAD-binding protein [Curtobacterium flaccumfaciens]
MSGLERIVLIGAGPRGLAVLERICANARGSNGRFEIFVVDPAEPGAGAVWRSDQPSELLMNTVASQVSVFPDRSVSMRGPVEDGPSLYEWAATIASDEAALQEEKVPLGPDDYPSRRLYGDYLSFAFRTVQDRAPVNVSIEAVKDVAVRLHPTDDSGRRCDVILRDGETIRDADHVVMSLGHGGVEPNTTERRLAADADSWGGVFLRPMNPADAELDGILPGEDVIVRGLGLNFFDYVALLTLGRGGSFVRDDEGCLRYRVCGAEPRLFVGSRRGIPHHARGRNEKGAAGRAPARLLDADRVEALRRQHVDRPLRFKLDVWPLIARDVECRYYETFLTDASARQEFTRRYLHCAEHARAGVLGDFALDTVPAWDWERLARPWHGAGLKSVSEYRTWAREYLLADVEHARLGNVSGPLKSALDLLRDLRNEIRSVIDHAGIEGQSYVDEIDGWYTPLNAFLSIGPPERRIEELVALMDAGVVTILGPGMTVETSGTGFVASSSVFADASVSAKHLIEARLPATDARTSQNPLIVSMLSAGLLTLHSHRAEDAMIESGGIAVTTRPYRVLNDTYPGGHPRLFLYGVPTEAVHWVTAAGARPGVDSITFRDADAIALAILDADSAEKLDRHDPESAADVDAELAIR